MTKSQNTKNEQQNDLCITSEQLTEQWKKGELPERTKCYVKVNGNIYLGMVLYNSGHANKKLPSMKSFMGKFTKNNIESILAQVPSFNEWQAQENYIDYLKQCIQVYESKEKQHTNDSIAYNELAEENEKLKDLLKRAKDILEDEGDYMIFQEINEVLK